MSQQSLTNPADNNPSKKRKLNEIVDTMFNEASQIKLRSENILHDLENFLDVDLNEKEEDPDQIVVDIWIKQKKSLESHRKVIQKKEIPPGLINLLLCLDREVITDSEIDQYCETEKEKKTLVEFLIRSEIERFFDLEKNEWLENIEKGLEDGSIDYFVTLQGNQTVGKTEYYSFILDKD